MKKKIINYLQKEGITSEKHLIHHIKKLREMSQREIHQTQELFDLVWAVHNKREELREIFEEASKVEKYWTVDVTLPVQLFYNTQKKHSTDEKNIKLCTEKEFLKRVREKNQEVTMTPESSEKQKKAVDELKKFFESAEYSVTSRQNSRGVKETEGKLDHSEINLDILDLMAERFMVNKHKYPKGNSKKEIAVEGLVQAMFRHIKKMIKPPLDDEETFEDHLAAVLCGGSMVLDQLERKKRL